MAAMNPCDTCAFGNAGAGKEPENALTGLVCALGAIPFFCHHAQDGAEYDWAHDPLGPLRLHPANRRVCAGWKANVRVLKAAGFFSNDGIIAIRRYAARRALQWLKRMSIHDIGRGKQKKANVELKRCVKFLSARDIDKLLIPR